MGIPADPSDRDIFRAIFSSADYERILRENPGLTKERLLSLYRRLDAYLGRAQMKADLRTPLEKLPADAGPVEKVILWTDGGSRGNPGPAGFGFVITDEANRLIVERGEFIGEATSNEAEYRALIAGLEEAKKLGAKEVNIRADSELLVRQLNGQYKIRSRHLMPLFIRAIGTLKTLKWNAKHIPREENARADALANEAMDRDG